MVSLNIVYYIKEDCIKICSLLKIEMYFHAACLKIICFFSNLLMKYLCSGGQLLAYAFAISYLEGKNLNFILRYVGACIELSFMGSYL